MLTKDIMATKIEGNQIIKIEALRDIGNSPDHNQTESI